MGTPLPRSRPTVPVVAADARLRMAIIAALADRLTDATLLGAAGGEGDHLERTRQFGADEPRRGCGLALTRARRIVGSHGGHTRAERGRADGALLGVDLPDAGGGRGRDGAV